MYNHDMQNKKVGEAIKQLRKQKKLTHAQLSKSDNPSETICSEKTLRRIEKGEILPSEAILNGLLSVLGITRAKFYNLVEGQDMTNFQNDFAEIWQLCFKGQLQDARKQLDILKLEDYCNTNNPMIAQAVLLCEGRLQADIDKDYQGCLNTLYNALRLTCPSIIPQDGKIKYRMVSGCVLTLNEYRIISLISSMKGVVGQRAIAIKIFNAMCKSLNNEKIDSGIRNTFLPTIYYNLSDFMIDEKRYNQAFDVCEQGIEFCKRIDNLKLFPKLLYNRAKALHYMKDKERATKGFRNAHDTFIAHGDYNAAEFVKKTVAEKYQIYL